jgi:HSP20 family protein
MEVTGEDPTGERRCFDMLMTRLRATTAAPFSWPDLSWFPFFEPNIRVEEYVEDDRYVVRAELPGVDPVKDVEVTYIDGALRLTVERSEEHKEKGRTEFHYGSFHRTIPLPPGAKEDTIVAKYLNGILEISVLVGEPAMLGKSVPITIGDGQAKTAKKVA